MAGGAIAMGISTHILDTTTGMPAAQVPVTLFVEENGVWSSIFVTATDHDGRCKQLLPESRGLHAGTYRIFFATEVYFASQKAQGLYPYVEITFTVTNLMKHYHIPLLLTANGYTTYRGS
jgi:5-hydroxyisourate hydrolase